MELLELIAKRRSVRRYKPDAVPEADIKYILEAARLAPSWANTQCWHFVVVTDEDVKAKVGQAGFRWTARTPVIIVACADAAKVGAKKDQEYYLVDIGIVMEHLILAATERGLGTCWIGGFDEAVVQKALGVPENIRVVAYTPLGYPDEAPDAMSRKSFEEIVSRNQYGHSA